MPESDQTQATSTTTTTTTTNTVVGKTKSPRKKASSKKIKTCKVPEVEASEVCANQSHSDVDSLKQKVQKPTKRAYKTKPRVPLIAAETTDQDLIIKSDCSPNKSKTIDDTISEKLTKSKSKRLKKPKKIIESCHLILSKRDGLKKNKRREKLLRVLFKHLKGEASALQKLTQQDVLIDIDRALGSRSGSLNKDRERTVYVTFTSANFEQVKLENPHMQPKEVFQRLAYLWKSVKNDPVELEKYTALRDNHTAMKKRGANKSEMMECE